MIKCSNCNKKFDEEKFYGICPKCGTFNHLKSQTEDRDELYMPTYEELAPEQRATKTPQPSQMHNTSSGQIYPSEQGQQRDGQLYNPNKGKNLMLLLIVLVIIGIATPIFIGVSLFSETKESKEEGIHFEKHEVGLSESIYMHGMNVKVRGARVVEPVVPVENLPVDSNVVAISIDLLKDEKNLDESDPYKFQLEPYIGYGDTYRECLYSANFEEYKIIYPGINVLNAYMIGYEEEMSGDIIAFVEKGITEMTVSFEERDDTENSITIYEVVVPIVQEEINEP